MTYIYYSPKDNDSIVTVSGAPEPYTISGVYEVQKDGIIIENTMVSGSKVYIPGNHPEDYPDTEMERLRHTSPTSTPL